MSAGVDLSQPAPFMIWFDGQNMLGSNGLSNYRLQTVTDNLLTDNLVHRGKIPPVIHILIHPGAGEKPLKLQFSGQELAHFIEVCNMTVWMVT